MSRLGKQLMINVPLKLMQTKVYGGDGNITTTVTFQRGVTLKFVVRDSGMIQVESNKQIALNNAGNSLDILL